VKPCASKMDSVQPSRQEPSNSRTRRRSGLGGRGPEGEGRPETRRLLDAYACWTCAFLPAPERTRQQEK
jgi:hypothetical protein